NAAVVTCIIRAGKPAVSDLPSFTKHPAVSDLPNSSEALVIREMGPWGSGMSLDSILLFTIQGPNRSDHAMSVCYHRLCQRRLFSGLIATFLPPKLRPYASLS